MRAALLSLLIAALIAPAAAQAAYAPLDRPGPALEVRAADVDAATKCSPGIAGASRAPVLLSPGTGATADENFSWNYERSLTARGIPWCGITMPGHAQGDIQVAGEYLVHAIRRIHRLSGRRVAVMGHSQGGMSMRWALRFWPDTRADGGRRDRLRRQQPRHRLRRRLRQRLHAGRVAAGSQVELHRRAEQPRRDPCGRSPTPRSTRTATRS